MTQGQVSLLLHSEKDLNLPSCTLGGCREQKKNCFLKFNWRLRGFRESSPNELHPVSGCHESALFGAAVELFVELQGRWEPRSPHTAGGRLCCNIPHPRSSSGDGKEQFCSTGVSMFIAFPHLKTSAVVVNVTKFQCI